MTDKRVASRYRLLDQLGQGGMGVVHKAIDEVTGTHVAVKLVHAEMISEDEGENQSSRLARFFREAKASSAIEGPHVARTLDSGTDESTGQPYLIMELLEGEDLQSALKRISVFSPDVALRIASQAVRGLIEAHKARVVHRDIKPANIFLARTSSGEIVVKILDFGIAKIRAENDSIGENTGLTVTGNMLGSPKYMSPEQARGSRAVDHRSDLWSLGVVLYRMLTGHTPHEDVTAVGEFIIVLCTERAEPVQHFAPWVVEETSNVVDDALQIDVEDRYESAEEMLAALTALLPNGDSLRVDDIATFSESARGAAPPVAASVWPGGPGSGSRSGVSSRSGSKSRTGSGSRRAPRSGSALSSSETTPLGPPDSSDPSVDKIVSSTGASMANTQNEPVPPPRRTTLFASIGIGAAVLIGLAAFLTRQTPSASENNTRPATDAPAMALSGNASGNAGERANRSANLVVLPSDALVEIDEAKATAVDGVVTIVGALGSKHRVRISKDGQEKVINVLIGPNGAEPPKVELVIAASVGATPAGTTRPVSGSRPATKKTSEPSAPQQAPTVRPRDPLIPDRFE